METENYNKNSSSMSPDKNEITKKTIENIEKEFVVVGRWGIFSWKSWLALGIIAGLVVGVFFVTNKKGTLELSRANNAADTESAKPTKRIEYDQTSIIVKLKKENAPLAASLDKDGGVSSSNPVILRQNLKSLKKILASHKIKNKNVKARIEARGVDRLFRAEVTGDVFSAIRALRSDPAVEYAELDYIVETTAIPNDPSFPQLWGMHNTGQSGGASDADIDAPEAWDKTTQSSIIVGVIDTGVDYNHEDLTKNMWQNEGEIPQNGIDDDANGFVDDMYGWDFVNNDNDPFDDHGHGTHVAGTIGAMGNNGIGVAGVNWNTKIAALKFLSSSGSGSASNAISAIQYANMMGFKITSNSWGGGGFSQALYDAIAAANASGNLFVAAAGNSGQDADTFPMYPAAYDLPNIISVAATDHNDALASFSNYGLTSVDIGAPGLNIFSSVPKGACSLCNPSGYRMLSGTSMATPYVSGSAALLWSYKPTLDHNAIKSALLSGTNSIPALSGKSVSGGRLNIANLFENDITAPAKITNLSSTRTLINGITLSWTAVGDDGTIGKASRYEVRYSTASITSANFSAATLAGGLPSPQSAGTPEIVTITGLAPATTYNFAIKAFDNVGNASPISNTMTRKTATPVVAFFDDMERPDMWTIDGSDGKGGGALWHLSTRRAASPTHSFYYGNEVKGNFDTGARNFGSLTSGEIDLSKSASPVLTFNHFLQTENFSPYDRAEVQISKDGGATWQTIFVAPITASKWRTETVDLLAYEFMIIRLRFQFDTVDSLFNQFEGWFVDDVEIIASTASNKPPIADIGGPYAGTEGYPILFDASKSRDPEGKELDYTWDFGDGQPTITTKDKTISHTYLKGGSYIVSLVVNDGIVNSRVVKITVKVALIK